jgi:hypothetical protein
LLTEAIRGADTNDMAAAAGRKDEYETYNQQFCTRLVEYLMIMIKFQVSLIECETGNRPTNTLLQAETAASASASKAASGEIEPHAQMEQKLGMYCGLILYMIEMDEERYQKLCTVSLIESKSDRWYAKTTFYIGLLQHRV